MGPYCKFCGHRCFVHFPDETPSEALKAYGTSNIIATCPGGQEFENDKVGWNYAMIQAAISLRRDTKNFAIDWQMTSAEV